MHRFAFVALVAFAACAGSPPAPPTPIVPLGEPAPPVDLSRDQGQRAAADRSAPVPAPAPAPVTPGGGGGGGDTSVTFRTVTELVPPPAAEPAATGWSSGQEVDGGSAGRYVVDPYPYGYPYSYGYPYGYYHGTRRHRETWFPVGTVVGLGVGSAIGRHNGHRGRGAWIGGSVGLLFDMHRWWR